MAQGASDYVRGFSFMSENKVEVIDLQYIEGGELSRAWKMTRRERLKNIEAKIWDEFINERDIVDSVSSDDPYQFLDKLPDDCIREVLDTELTIMEKEMAGETPVENSEPPVQQEFKDPHEPRETMVTFAEALEDEQCDVIAIVEEEEGTSEVGEREEINESMDSPCTVRERSSPEGSPRKTERKREDKSPENLRNMIETSIYSAKVKELQSKVNLELLAVSTTLEVQNLSQIDPNSLVKLEKQCSDFCARYSRIYLYPITRQLHDITRHNSTAAPFARHTHTRSQMIRAVSLHQNILQSLQMYHKWITQKTPLRECVFALKNLLQHVREADSVSPAEVHNEELLQTCESLSEVLTMYLNKLNDFFGTEHSTKASAARSGKAFKSMKKKAFGQMNKQGLKTKPEIDAAKLSMYSLDKFQRHSKSSIGRLSGGTSKAQMPESSPAAKVEDTANPTSCKKTVRSRRPLMRAPGARGPRRARARADHENISTLVEAVDVVSSPRPSAPTSVRSAAPPPAAPSPPSPPSPPAPRTPRTPRTPRAARRATCSPRAVRGVCKIKDKSPCKSPKLSPQRKQELKVALKGHNSEDTLPSVITVQCAKKDSPVVSTPQKTAPQNGGKTEEYKKDANDVNSSSDVSVLLRRICAGQSVSKSSPRERASGSKNAQLLCVNGGSPRMPSLGTPLLLRILEETIQKQAPKPQFRIKSPPKDIDRFRIGFNRTGAAAEALFQYRTKFLQHMLSSPMYANSAVGKPWEMIGIISENIIDEILLSCAKEMQLEHIIEDLYKREAQL